MENESDENDLSVEKCIESLATFKKMVVKTLEDN